MLSDWLKFVCSSVLGLVGSAKILLSVAGFDWGVILSPPLVAEAVILCVGSRDGLHHQASMDQEAQPFGDTVNTDYCKKAGVRGRSPQPRR